MLYDTYMPTARAYAADFAASLSPTADPLHKKWLGSLAEERAAFGSTADLATRGLSPVRDSYKESYRVFQKYLSTTLDMVEMVPKYVDHGIELRYSSGLSAHELSTAGFGKLG